MRTTTAPRVLVVDDDPAWIELMGQALHEVLPDAVVLAAEGGDVALARLQTDPVDLVLLDLDMPGFDGRQVLEALAASGQAPSVVVVSGSSRGNDVELCRALAAGHVAKPDTLDDLVAALRRIVAPTAPTASSGTRVVAVGAPAVVAAEGIELRHVESADALLGRPLSGWFDCVVAPGELVGQVRSAAPDVPVVAIVADGEAAPHGVQDALSVGELQPASVRRAVRYAVERAAFDELLSHQAHHDPLTGVPNRTLLVERLSAALEGAALHGTVVGVCMVDLDAFHMVNERYGRDAGDQVLATVAARLRGAVRPHDTVARIGSDAFAICCDAIDDAGVMDAVAARVAAAVSEPITVSVPAGAFEIVSSAAIGVATTAGCEAEVDALLDAAEAHSRRGGAPAAPDEPAVSAFRLLAERSTDVLARRSPDGRYVYVSPAVREVLGYEPEDLVGRHVHELAHPEDLADRGSTGLLATRARHRDGSWVWLETTLHEVRDPSTGELLEVQTASRDVSARRRAEEEVRSSERLFRATFESALTGMAVLDVDARFVRVNEVLARMLGRDERSLAGAAVTELLHPDDVPGAWQEIRAVLAGEQAGFRAERRYVRADGAVAWADIVLSLVRDEDGTPLHFSMQALDVTEARLASEGRRRWELVFERSRLGMTIVEPESGRILAANPALARMHGYEVVDLEGAPLASMFTPESAARIPELAARVAADGCIVYESEHQRRDGSVFPVRTEVLAFHDDEGRVTFRAAFFDDITDERRVDVERERALAAFEEANAELARSNADLEQFAYVASHDLKSPLFTIGAFADLLSRRCGDSIDDKGREWLGLMRAGVSRMSTMIDGLLAYCRAGTESLGDGPVDLAVVVDDVVAGLSSTIAAAGGSVVRGPLPVVRGDVVQLGVVLQNLVTNGLKFVPGDRRPEVRISAERHGDEWFVHVDDNGVGIPPEQRDRVLQMFQRLHSREDYEGTGIGLAIAARVVERLGGRLWADEPPEGAGARFCVSLPAAY